MDCPASRCTLPELSADTSEVLSCETLGRSTAQPDAIACWRCSHSTLHSTRDDSSNVDGAARAELPCYLAVGQRVVRARTGGRLRTDHVGELLSIWLEDNGARANLTVCILTLYR